MIHIQIPLEWIQYIQYYLLSILIAYAIFVTLCRYGIAFDPTTGTLWLVLMSVLWPGTVFLVLLLTVLDVWENISIAVKQRRYERSESEDE